MDVCVADEPLPVWQGKREREKSHIVGKNPRPVIISHISPCPTSSTYLYGSARVKYGGMFVEDGRGEKEAIPENALLCREPSPGKGEGITTHSLDARRPYPRCRSKRNEE